MNHTIFTISLAALALLQSCASSKIKHAKNESFHIHGNCESCKASIENASTEERISLGMWDTKTQILTLTFDSTKTNADALLKKVALAGFDNDRYVAPAAAYDRLDSCCKYTRKHLVATSKPDDVRDTLAKDSQNSKPELQKSNPLEQVYANYFLLKDALVKDNATLAAKYGNALLQESKNVAMHSLTENTHKIWMQQLQTIQNNSEQIGKTADIEKQRQSFLKLSDALYPIMQALPAEYSIYYDFCPMYNDGNGGHWMSKESSIKNPFYGSSMLTCGSNKSTIKAK